MKIKEVAFFQLKFNQKKRENVGDDDDDGNENENWGV
jgi:hypothetical protein